VIAGLTAALFYAYSPAMIITSVRGLREELIILFFVAYAAAYIWNWGRLPSVRNYIWLGLIASLSIQVRLSSNAFIVVSLLILFAYSAWKHRVKVVRWWLLIVPILFSMLPIVPYLVYCKVTFGVPFYSVMMTGVRFYANVELAGVNPDFPTREQFNADGFAGGPISMGTYLFKYHTAQEIFRRFLLGGYRTYFGDFSRVWLTGRQDRNFVPSDILQWLGLLAMLIPGPRLVFSMLLFLFHAPGFFLFSFDYFDWRLVTVAFAGFAIGIGAPAETAVNLVFRDVLNRESNVQNKHAVSRREQRRTRMKKRTSR
jgi:hypothetical protein